MSKTTLYNGIIAEITDLGFDKEDGSADTVKTVGLWRNQIARSNEETPIRLPGVFIEFLPTNYMESSSKSHQTVDMTVRMHILYETYKTTDLDLLNLTQAVYSALQGKQWGYWGKMKRRNEEQDFDHDSVQDFIQDYHVGQGKDYGADARPSTPATINTINIDVEKVDAIE